ncbi:alpha/beta hydrolase [Caballeronia sp. SEWSISQ10-4 2]|uniref:alpha/beta fold hydrolase n=1 Tax=Caballeronia sp. SEWSISQ10-4 2 TaxID=2937438 RepID=UPI0026540652|nr:alpha/beta hydrolase [Caballeronia sp. SEWSISQ10-4 2]MDN7179487.1 alpha/beta hydrolase [Caballeronia sp. SEWSISQ10-4 2]
MIVGMQHKFAHVNGIRMHYVEKGDGPLVLLCHGWPESWYVWRSQIDSLAAGGYRVVAPDQRGYGLTDAPEAVESYDVLNLVGDLVGLVKALGEEQAILIGHDWGAAVAAYAALLRPDLFPTLGLLSVPYAPRRPTRPSARFALATQERHFYQEYFQQPGRVERELEEDVRRALLGILYTASGDAAMTGRSANFVIFDKATRFIDNLALPDELPSWLTDADLQYLAGQFERSGFCGPINWYRNIDRNWSMTGFLDGARIMQPTLFVAGEFDGVLKIVGKDFDDLEVNVPNLWKKHLVPKAGHWVQQERPDEVNEVILKFLAEQSNNR